MDCGLYDVENRLSVGPAFHFQDMKKIKEKEPAGKGVSMQTLAGGFSEKCLSVEANAEPLDQSRAD